MMNKLKGFVKKALKLVTATFAALTFLVTVYILGKRKGKIETVADNKTVTKAKEIKDYELNKEKLPKNSKGTMIVERKEDKVITEVVVRYYYDKEKKTEGNNNSSNNPSNGTQNNNNTNTNNPISNNSQTIKSIYWK